MNEMERGWRELQQRGGLSVGWLSVYGEEKAEDDDDDGDDINNIPDQPMAA